MKTSNFFRISIVAASLTFMFACKKDSSSASSSPTTAANVQTASDDQTMVSNEDEATNNDAELALTSSASIAGNSLNSSGKSGASTLGLGSILGISLCGDSLSFDTTSDTKTVTITYDGMDCLGANSRTGTISITVPKGVHWGDPQATVTLNVDLTITRKRDGKSIVIKGTKTIINTYGGLLTDLATTDSIVHEISSQWSVTYNNGTTRTWNVLKHRVFTYNNGVVISTVNGINSSVAEWGVNRFGVSFSSSITQPKVFAQSCDFRLVSGQDSLTRGDKITAIITYGLDASGNPVTSCPSGSFYAELVWTNSVSGKTYTFIYPY
jgi:hypothetical protein